MMTRNSRFRTLDFGLAESGFPSNLKSKIANPKLLTFAHSPDPDDAFMFYGFACGAVALPDHTVRHHLEDIESLNAEALKGKFEITAVSVHGYAYCSDRYWMLSCGASVGRGYGPILVGRSSHVKREASGERRDTLHDSRALRIAIPGKRTTAVLVLDLWLAEHPELKIEMVVLPFNKILSAVSHGDAEAGLIIHEGQLTYSSQGLEKIWDAGEWWKQQTGLPLPLGLDVVRKDLGRGLAREIGKALRKSILHARAHPKEAMDYALQFGRGLDRSLGNRFIGMYVNEDTLNQGNEVQRGLEMLYQKAFAADLIPRIPGLTFI